MNEINNKIEKLKEQGDEIKKEVKERTLSYIMAALGLVAGLE